MIYIVKQICNVRVSDVAGVLRRVKMTELAADVWRLQAHYRQVRRASRDLRMLEVIRYNTTA